MKDRDLQNSSDIKEFGKYGVSHSFIQERKKKKKNGCTQKRDEENGGSS